MDSIEPVVTTLCESIDQGTLIDEDILKDTENGISLLALKNEALLSYISNLLLVAAAQLENNEECFDEARKRTVEQRVTLEKGIKGLEAKISYQIDKALRAHKRFEEQQAAEDKRAEDAQNDAANSDSDSDVDLTSYRPNVSSMKKPGKKSSRDNDDDSGLDDDDKKRYVVPKISSTAPKFESDRAKRAPRKRDFAMEEYIRETGEAPIAEASIGSQIMDSGRGGERTARDRKKANEIKAYEEANFTRISQVSAKRARKEAAQRQRDATAKSFFGEDWGFLDHSDEKRRGKKQKTKH